MIAVPRTRGFSASNWQILLTNNNSEFTAIGMYSLWGEVDSRSFRKADFIQIKIHIVLGLTILAYD